MADYAIRLADMVFETTTIGSIEVGDRFRKDYGDLAELAQNITKEGLIQPISVCRNPEGSEFPYRLVAGGRRFSAIKLIKEKVRAKDPSAKIPIMVRVYKELNEYQLRVLEYAENLYRKDLTWQEQVQLQRKIHELQIKEHGKKFSTTPGAPGWSQKDTADMLGKSVGKISEDLKLAKMMEDLPQVDWSKFKAQADVKKALKGAEKAVTQHTNAIKAEKILKTGEDRKRVLVDAYHVEDFFDGVKKIDDHSIDLCEIDPPYAIDLENAKKDYNYTGYNEIPADRYPAFMKRTFKECYRVMKTNSWMIVWFAPEPWAGDMYNWIVEAGFRTNRLCGQWIKGIENEDGIVETGQGQTKNPEYSLVNVYESFYYCKKGTPILNRPASTNIFGYRPIPHAHKYHPTERPKELMTDVLNVFGHTNDKVLVPFAGSGRTLLEAAKLSMIPIGFDLTKEYRDGYIIRVHKEI